MLRYALPVLQRITYLAHSKIHMDRHSPTALQNSVSDVLEEQLVQTLIVRYATMTGLRVKRARKDIIISLVHVLKSLVPTKLNIM